jgi:hypothetical protein
VENLRPNPKGRSGVVGNKSLHPPGIGDPAAVPRSGAREPSVVFHPHQQVPTVTVGQANDFIDNVLVGKRLVLLALEFNGEGFALGDKLQEFFFRHQAASLPGGIVCVCGNFPLPGRASDKHWPFSGPSSPAKAYHSTTKGSTRSPLAVTVPLITPNKEPFR